MAKVTVVLIILGLLMVTFSFYEIQRGARDVFKQGSSGNKQPPIKRIYEQDLSCNCDVRKVHDGKKLSQLSTLMQRRLHDLQNPANCNEVKKIVCRPEQPCGYGCQVHHFAFCLMVAYSLNRTLVLDFDNFNEWPYNQGWTELFEPISSTCLDKGQMVEWDTWGRRDDRVPSFYLPEMKTIQKNTYPNFEQGPKDISNQLKWYHGSPVAWWAGQVLAYLQRLKPEIKTDITKTMEALGFQHPIIGIHIRRTDKLVYEAFPHNFEEYMVQAESYYKRLSNTETVKRVFMVTDDIGFVKNASIRYPDYVFIMNEKEGEEMHSQEALHRIITNIHILSNCDFLVCTFSSNVCRLAYEMMQTVAPDVDASSHVRSLDDDYFFF